MRENIGYYLYTVCVSDSIFYQAPLAMPMKIILPSLSDVTENVQARDTTPFSLQLKKSPA